MTREQYKETASAIKKSGLFKIKVEYFDFIHYHLIGTTYSFVLVMNDRYLHISPWIEWKYEPDEQEVYLLTNKIGHVDLGILIEEVPEHIRDFILFNLDLFQ